MAIYSGWENWETWQMAMILDMNEDLQEVVVDRIQEESIDELEVPGMIRETAKFLSDYIWDQLPALEFPWEGFFMSVLDRVNWKELAENYLKEWKLLTKKGEKRLIGPREWSP